MAFLDYTGLRRFKDRITPIRRTFTLTGTASAPYVSEGIVYNKITDTMIPQLEYRGDTSVLSGNVTVTVDNGEVTVSARLIGTIDIEVILEEMQT